MLPKPEHLGLPYASQFKDQSIIDAYHFRVPHPPALFSILKQLVPDEPRIVLDVGCGTGEIARGLVDDCMRVDAVDFSLAMIEKGRQLPGGNSPRLRWIFARIEAVPLSPPYSLITAGDSLHWMEWDVVMPLFKRILIPGGLLAIVSRGITTNPWDERLAKLLPRFSTNQAYRPFNLVEELEQRGLFQLQSWLETNPVPFAQSVDDYIESYHSMNGLSRDRMSAEMAMAFDNEARDAVSSFQQNGHLSMQAVGTVTWGIPGSK